MERENELAQIIIDTAFEVRKLFGPGLLESIYQEALFRLLVKKGLKVEKQYPVKAYMNDELLGVGYRIDLLVEDLVVIEVKSVSELHDIHFFQTLTYLKLCNLKLGLIINFNSILLKDGIRRVANRLYPISN